MPLDLSRVHRKSLALSTATLLIVGMCSTVSAANAAVAVPTVAQASPVLPETVSADSLPTVQINGVVWSQAIAGDTVYVGGEFTKAIPPTEKTLVNAVGRSNILAYSLSTGQLLKSWNPGANAEIQQVVVTPDQSKIFVSGSFTTIGGQPRNHVAGFDAKTGALLDWAPDVNNRVSALAVTNTTVYLGGIFSRIGNASRDNLAAVSAVTGAVLPWSAHPDGGNVQALTINPAGTKVVVGGSFTSVNGSDRPGYGMAMLDAVTGALLPLPVNNLIRNGTSGGAIYGLTASDNAFYGVAYSFRFGGTNEGAFKVDWDGNLVWVEDCHGDSYSVAVMNDVVYKASHSHFCGNIGGFQESRPRMYFHATAFTDQATSTATREASYVDNPTNPLRQFYWNFEGQPTPTLLPWTPKFNTGRHTGQNQGPWNVISDPNKKFILYAGEFTTVNGKRQQGLARFPIKSVAPNESGPKVSGPDFVVTGTALEKGSQRLSWTSNYDYDNESLNYQLFRDGDMSKAIYEVTAKSQQWKRPVLSFVDSGLEPGKNYSYRLRAKDSYGNTATGDWVTVTAPVTGELSAYDKNVLKDALHYWPNRETSGTISEDLAGASDLVSSATISRVDQGAVLGGTGKSLSFDGAPNSMAVSKKLELAPNVFSIEAWFKSSSLRSGRIAGFSPGGVVDAKTPPGFGISNRQDRTIYLDDKGKLSFGVFQKDPNIVSSSASFNDGKWHHVVASLDPSGMKLFADGQKVAERSDIRYGLNSTNGFWRIGGDRGEIWPGSRSLSIQGEVDQFAVYSTVLSEAKIRDHYTLATSGTVAQAPVAPAFTQTVAGKKLTLTVTSPIVGVTYRWDLGDGSTASGSTVSHAYAAAGSFPVNVIATDASGRESDKSLQSVVIAENIAPNAVVTQKSVALTATLDATQSFDTDGTIASYLWTFPDGASAQGSKITRTFASQGVYSVKLTLTDNEGAVTSVDTAVVVSPSGQAVPFAVDAFDRTASSTFGTADLGGVWRGINSDLSVSGGKANIVLSKAGTSLTSILPATAQSNTDSEVSFSVARKATGATVFVSLIGRSVSSDEYRARVKVSDTGEVTLNLQTQSLTLASVPIPGLTYSAGDVYRIRLQVAGTGKTVLSAKVWKTSAQEPAAWQATASDSTPALQSTGFVGINAYLSSKATMVPATVSFDDFVSRKMN